MRTTAAIVAFLGIAWLVLLNVNTNSQLTTAEYRIAYLRIDSESAVQRYTQLKRQDSIHQALYFKVFEQLAQKGH
jgi:hypothetical protein